MDWQEGSGRVRLQSEVFSFSETQGLMRPILKMWFLCTSCVSTVLMPMCCTLNAFKTYRDIIICSSALFLPRFFYWEFSSRQSHWTSPSLLTTGLWVLSGIPSLACSFLLPCALGCSLGSGAWVSQARGTVCFLPQEKRLQEASQSGLRTWDVFPHSPALR